MGSSAGVAEDVGADGGVEGAEGGGGAGAGAGAGAKGVTTLSGSTGAAFSAEGVSPRSRRRIRIRQYFRFDAP